MRFKPTSALTAAILLILAVFAPDRASAADPPADTGKPPVERRVVPQPPATSAAIPKWIDELGSDSYSVRESASGHLIRAGRSAIGDVARATQKDDLEITTRAVQILAAMLKSEDLDTADAAADALAKISTVRNASTASMAAAGAAADALVDYQGRTLEQIQRLGGEVQFGVPYTTTPDGIQVTFNSNWHDGLKILKHVPNLEHLSLRGFPLSDDDLADLANLPHLRTLDLFSTRVTQAGAVKFEREHPSIHVDRRGAMLGVAGGFGGTCQIDRIEPNSAAERAGLMINDVILKFQGQAVNNFSELTARIGACRGGDKVMLQISRSGQLLDKEVTLGDWK